MSLEECQARCIADPDCAAIDHHIGGDYCFHNQPGQGLVPSTAWEAYVYMCREPGEKRKKTPTHTKTSKLQCYKQQQHVWLLCWAKHFCLLFFFFFLFFFFVSFLNVYALLCLSRPLSLQNVFAMIAFVCVCILFYFTSLSLPLSLFYSVL